MRYSYCEDERGEGEQIGGIGLPAPFGIDPAAQIADQVRPAHLASFRRNKVAVLVGMSRLRTFGPGSAPWVLAGRGGADGGSEEGGLDEFCEFWLRRGSNAASFITSSAINWRTSGGVACHASSLSSAGRCGSSIAVVCRIVRFLATQTRGNCPSLNGYLYRYCIADSYFLAGDYQEAEALFLTLEGAEQDFHCAMVTGWLSLAQIALRRGELAEVVVRLQKANVLGREFKHRRYVGEIHRVWSQVHALRGELSAARASIFEAIDIFERLGMRRELAEAREELRRLDEMGEAPTA